MRWLNTHGVTVQAMIAFQGGGPFLASFVLALGASNYEIGLITSIAFIGEFMQIPGLFLLKTLRKRRAIAEASGPVRLFSTIPGIRHLIDLPFAALNWKHNRDSNESSPAPSI
jgi:hypothetical protein